MENQVACKARGRGCNGEQIILIQSSQNMSRFLIDNLQYCNWSEKIFRQLRESEVDAIHVTVAYHQGFREMVSNLESWNRYFEEYAKYITRGLTGDHVRQAKKQDKTAIFFGLQNPGPIEDDLGLVEICHQLGIRFMQLSYNNQSLLASGVHEPEDRGLTRFGRETVSEMNRVGLVVDMSHSGARSTMEAIDHSTRPIAITHANPYFWEPSVRNKSDDVLRELAQSGGMLGFSLYPNHLKNGTNCSLTDFCQMVAETVSRYGIESFGIGSDLCQDQPDEVVGWMRFGLWSRNLVTGSEKAPAFPPMPSWFRDNRDWKNIRTGLQSVGFSTDEIAKIMGENWLQFYDKSFGPVP